ncbi:SDR family oxidoreductase [Streptomyces sp. NPDC048309]|uniref:SDR family oxidoreductase n=1 Tax=Streptomyces sp. NPDC048309 TaxID=3154618 RepID=UPI00340F0A06
MCSATSAARRASSSDWPSNCAENQDEAAFDALFDINVKGTFFTLQKALPLLNEGASVVFTVGAGEVAGAAMTAAKGALLPLMRSLALELAPRHIRINAVSPGGKKARVWSRLITDGAQLSAVSLRGQVQVRSVRQLLSWPQSQGWSPTFCRCGPHRSLLRQQTSRLPCLLLFPVVPCTIWHGPGTMLL